MDAVREHHPRQDGSDAFSVERIPPPAAAGGGLPCGTTSRAGACIWLPIIFMGIICRRGLLWMLRYMPRTKPQEIKPDSSSAGRAGRTSPASRRRRTSCARSSSSCATRSASASSARRCPKGILLHGPPGTGKTLLAKAVAHESKAQFFAQSAASFVEMFAGLGAARIRRLFRHRAQGGARRSSSSTSSTPSAPRAASDISGEKDQTLNQLLVEMDGFAARDDVVVIAASNLLEKLDPALLRPGRFDRQIFVAPPDLQGPPRDPRRAHARQAAGRRRRPRARRPPDQRPDRRRPGQHLQRGRDLRRPRRTASDLLTRDFESALERVIAGMQSRRVITDHEKRVVAYHEAGHALCSELLPSVEQVAPHLDHPARPARSATRSTCPRRTAT